MKKGLTAEQFIDYCWEVVAWNAVSRGGKHTFSPEEEIKQLDYCLEEIQETLEAYEEEDLVEVLDGLADCLVTISYLIALVREADVLSFEAVKVSQIPDNSNNFYQRLAGSYQRLSTDCPMLIDAEIALLDVVGALNSVNDHWNEDVDVMGVIEEVLDSNWSKFPYLDQVVPMEECKWIEENRGKEGVYHSVIDNKIVFRDKGGKIMKPSTFKEPDISKHINKEGKFGEQEVIKVGTVVENLVQNTGLDEGEFYVVESVDEESSITEEEVVYKIREINGISGFGMKESWLVNGEMVALQGDQDDYDKIDISAQVAKIREKIALPQAIHCAGYKTRFRDSLG